MSATREQVIVSALSDKVPLAGAGVERYKRAQALPVMLIRHGLLQVCGFLEAKGAEDEQIRSWLELGVSAVLGTTRLKTATLAALPLRRYLLQQEVAVEVATWLKRIVEARLPQETP